MDALARIGFGLFGLAVLIGITWLFSNNRRRVNWKLVGTGLLLQIVLACFVLLTPWGASVFDAISSGFVKLLSFTTEGAKVVFGDFTRSDKFGFVFAFQVLPTIIFFASFMSVLYHLGIIQKVVQLMASAITKVMPVSGAETLSVCANAFVGQTEAPLVVKPYIARMTQSELLTLMLGGMATIAGGVLAAYVTMLGGNDPAQQAFFAKHLLTASIMAAPATLVIAKVLMPETEHSDTMGKVEVKVERTTSNVIDAAAAGASDGLKLALNVGAMLLAFTALIALLNAPLIWLGEVTGLAEALGQPTSLANLLGKLLAPLAWVIGVPWQDAAAVGSLIGTKVVINEFLAYQTLSQINAGQVPGVAPLTAQGQLVATYALCGFANFSSIAIQIGGIGGLAPERRQDLARLGLKAVFGGTIATMMTATIASVLYSLAG
ncbi:NupC/NupG family nucleoside CNT transporter [Lysobacteraceae bacterium NML120232]|nr:NupC/NupG family nucleoside CNT transporter [Xanthomonadaceae bacterium NML120232]